MFSKQHVSCFKEAFFHAAIHYTLYITDKDFVQTVIAASNPSFALTLSYIYVYSLVVSTSLHAQFLFPAASPMYSSCYLQATVVDNSSISTLDPYITYYTELN